MESTSDEVIFDGAEAPEVVEAEPEGVKEEAAEVEPEKVEAEAEEVSSPDPEVTHVPLTAIHGERDRRKAAERELAELKAELTQNQQKEPTSVFEDEGKFRQEVTQDLETAFQSKLIDFSEKFARKIHGSEVVDKSIEWFKEAAPASPLLKQQFADSGNDVDEIVTMYNAHLEVEALKDVDGIKAKLKAEAKAEARAEIEAELKEKANLRGSIPESLVGEPSAGGLSSKDWNGPPSDQELFDNK